MNDDAITLEEAASRSGVPAATLEQWARAGVIPVDGDRWTTAAAAQARVVARMLERGHTLDSLREAVTEGRLAFGFVEELFPSADRTISLEEAARRTGLEPELI